MKKTIIVALSILLMLTAFTACNPTTEEDQTVSTAVWEYFNDDAQRQGKYTANTALAVAADGTYDLEISYAEGKYTFKVDGETLANDLAAAETENTSKKIQGLYFGVQANKVAPYSVTFTKPVITADGDSVEVPAFSDWVNSRDPQNVSKISQDGNSVTITSTKDPSEVASQNYQGLELAKADLMTEAAASWTVKTTMTVDTAIFDNAGTNVGFWVETAPETPAEDGFWQVIRLNSTAKAN